MTAQHPSAPETEPDANGLTEAERQSLADLVWPDNYADPDLDAVAEAVERIVAERVRVVEGERDVHEAYALGAHREREYQRARAESAEAAHEAEKAAHERLRAGVEALAEVVEAEDCHKHHHFPGLTDECTATALRSLLGGGGAR